MLLTGSLLDLYLAGSAMEKDIRGCFLGEKSFRFSGSLVVGMSMTTRRGICRARRGKYLLLSRKR
jgi:hypothetical protein